MKSVFILLTGLSGSGKTTLGGGLTSYYLDLEKKVFHLDGDVLRKKMHFNLGFGREDRRKQLMQTATLGISYLRKGTSIIASLIAPYDKDRRDIKLFIENQGYDFKLIYVDCPIEACIERDPKGLYEKVQNGEIKNFTGIDAPYESPENMDIHIYTQKLNYEECLEKIVHRKFI